MDVKQQCILLDEIGGEPLEGSGFEGEQPVREDQLVVEGSLNQSGEEQL
jgi:hypothetical protein